LLAAGVAAAGSVSARLSDSRFPETFESVKGASVLREGPRSAEVIVALVDRTDPTASTTQRVVTDFARRMSAEPDVEQVVTPYSPHSDELAGINGDALFLSVRYREPHSAGANPVADRIAAESRLLGGSLVAAGQARARVRIGGAALAREQTRRTLHEDVVRSEALSLPLTALLLVVVFGGIISACVPVFVALATSGTAMLALYGFSSDFDLDQNVFTLVTLLSLGLSIDYSLLLVARFRDERRADATLEDAVERAWQNSGRTIAFGAAIIIACMSGLLLFPIDSLAQVGVAGVSATLMAVLAALTLTPALIGLARNRLSVTARPAPPGRRGQHRADVGLFESLAAFIQRRPALIAVATLAFLLMAGTPVAGAVIKIPHGEIDPAGLEAVDVARDLTNRFHLDRPAVTVVARTSAPALTSWSTRWRGDPAVETVAPTRQLDPNLATVTFALRGGSQDDAALDFVRRLRYNRPPGTQSWVTGDAALLLDVEQAIRQGARPALAFMILVIFVLLFLMTGSVVVPLKALLTNLASLGATFGLVVLIFQDGVGSRPLDTQTIGGIDPFMAIIVFAISFGLAMDYEVFLLGRVREFYLRGHPTNAAVRLGLQNTGRIITSAATLMVVVFVCFGVARSGRVEQLGRVWLL
jgi:RND superfamily putative drug exporter